MIRRRALVAVGVAVAVAVAAVVLWRATTEDDPYEAYCAEVREHQQSIGEELAAGGESTGFINALPAFRLLQEDAPDDIRDEWDIVIDGIEGLWTALDDAGVDPATYDRESPPEDLAEADRERIDAAAASLASAPSQAAFAGVAQHARDVCHTPLSL